MVVARHDNEGEQFVTLVGETQERVLHNLCLPFVRKMANRGFTIEQPIDKRE